MIDSHNSAGMRKNPTGATIRKKNRWMPIYECRYVAVDSHLNKRNGSVESVFGIAGERPAGRKLAQEIANACNQLHAEGYAIFSVFPLTSGRVVEATVEAEKPVVGRTYTKAPKQPGSYLRDVLGPAYIQPATDSEEDDTHLIDTGVGYSVTDGVIIIARLNE